MLKFQYMHITNHGLLATWLACLKIKQEVWGWSLRSGKNLPFLTRYVVVCYENLQFSFSLYVYIFIWLLISFLSSFIMMCYVIQLTYLKVRDLHLRQWLIVQPISRWNFLGVSSDIRNMPGDLLTACSFTSLLSDRHSKWSKW